MVLDVWSTEHWELNKRTTNLVEFMISIACTRLSREEARHLVEFIIKLILTGGLVPVEYRTTMCLIEVRRV